MLLSKEEETTIRQAYHAYWDAYLSGDMVTFASFLDDNITVYGTAVGEIFTTKEETVNFYSATADQMTGKADFRNREINLKAIGNTIMINEQCHLYVLIEDVWTFYGHVRVTAIFEKKDNAWKLVHQHGSFPDSRTDEGQQIAAEKINEENLKLREAVKRRTVELEHKNRELEIESSLEKVRTVAMGMRKPDDMLQVCQVISDQLQLLGIKDIRNVQTAIIEGRDDGKYMNYQYFTQYGKGIIEDAEIAKHPNVQEMIARMQQSPDAFFTHSFEGSAMEEWKQYRKDDHQFPDPILEEAASVHFYFYSIGEGGLGLSAYTPLTDDNIAIFHRFRNVFALAYQRFRDIELAEVQAREAQIELALERVRSRTMAMYTSDELQDAAILLFQQIRDLGVDTGSCGFVIWENDHKNATAWMSSAEGGLQDPFTLPHTKNKIYEEIYSAKEEGKDFFANEVSGAELEKHFDYLATVPGIGEKIKQLRTTGYTFPEAIVYNTAFFKKGYLSFHTHAQIPEAHDIFRRFAIVFEQTYTRFLDLQKAEAQAREAQIEASLERVRARTMAMQRSDELTETSEELYRQLTLLGEPAQQMTIGIINEAEGVVEISATLQGNKLKQTFHHPISEPYFMQKTYNAWKARKKIFIHELRGDELIAYNHIRNQIVGENLFPVDLSPDSHRHIAVAFFSKGILGLATDEPRPAESIQLLERFASVFDLTYTRFLDLQKAEAQAREARIEASLERVRSIALGMRKADDLLDICEVLYTELEKLEFSGLRNTMINILDDQKESFLNYDYSPLVGKSITPVLYHANSLIEYQVKTLKASNDAFVEHIIQGEQLEELIALRIRQGEADDPRLRQVDTVSYYFYSIGVGAIGISSFNSLTEEQRTLLKRFRNVFEFAYRRYMDIAQAEASAREARIEASLERVRAKAMAMHSSEDLAITVDAFFTELKGLGVTPHRCGFGINDAETRSTFMIATTATQGDETKKVAGTLKLSGHPVLDNIFEHWLQQKEYHPVLRGKEILDYYKVLNPQVEVSTFAEDETQYGYYFFFKEGGVFAWFDTAMDESVLQIFRRFTSVLSLTLRRYMDLKEAEAQAREARIEAALEKVRSRTMAMQKSTELPEAANLLFQQVQALGMPAWSAGYTLWDEDKKAITLWMSSEGVIQSPFRAPLTEDPSFIHFLEAHQRGETLHVEEIGGDALVEHYAYMRTLPGVGEVLNKIIEAGFPLPTFQIFHAAYFTQGFLLFITYEPVPEAHDIFKRFANVFEQTYTRFLDLQKSEAQTRESRIEAALERVRSNAMAMHSSEDLSGTIGVFYRELKILSETPIRCGIALIDKESRNAEVTTMNTTEKGDSIEIIGNIKMAGHKVLDEIFQHWLIQKEYHVILRGTEIKEYYQMMRPQISYPDYPNDNVQHGYYFMFKEGDIYAWTEKELGEEDLQLYRRFANVISLTYKRYKDLIQAEANAREARIEAGLERVRSRTLAMHKSDELAETAAVVFRQLIDLGIAPNRLYIAIIHDDNGELEFWITDEDGARVSTQFLGHKDRNDSVRKMYDGWASQKKSITIRMEGKELQEYFHYLSDELHVPFRQGLSQKRRVQNIAYFSKGFIGIASPDDQPEETTRLLERFAAVFNLTYTRFADLQHAEAQSHKAKIEVALERVRARALAMQEPEELVEVAQVMRHEMGLLGVEELETSSIYIHDEGADIADCWYAIKDIRAPEKSLVADHIRMELHKTWVGREMLDFYNTNQQQTSIVMQGANRIEWINYCSGISNVLSGFYGEVIPDRTYHLYKFSNGAIGAAAEGDISEESWELLRRATSVFSLAYSRFKDLTQARIDLEKLKTEKQRAEEALSNLKAAQTQLIQAEKMASLGELTAGIAHEIQNPLNFVNNFSDVNTELIEEMKEELASGNTKEAIAIAKDIADNEQKINHHGKRADAIVKGMLQHSRTSSGVKEPTDINALADEYLRLAYHGLRAKDNTFNAAMKTDFDPSIGKVDVIPQDIGRVILNLITNAFFAVNEKKKQQIPGYDPNVTVSTRKTDDQVMISIKDNGHGIPPAILDKIFQPFFTTKPTGQGTGLGLSLSYDIVKAHGGELKVETREGEGTEFTIILPM